MARLSGILAFLAGLPPLLVYGLLGIGAALENIVPPVPADTFVLLGSFLAARGSANVWIVWGVTWAFNVGSALLVYWIGHRHGRTFFEVGAGRHLLNEHQLGRMRAFYARFGVFAIFFTRFLPGLRAVVPVFAGVSHQRFLPVAVPLALASGIWYGTLVWLGATAGRNLETVAGWIDDTNVVLFAVAAILGAGAFWWWVRTRRHRS
jgi:membrane protein DedA with SNARE-associated domain